LLFLQHSVLASSICCLHVMFVSALFCIYVALMIFSSLLYNVWFSLPFAPYLSDIVSMLHNLMTVLLYIELWYYECKVLHSQNQKPWIDFGHSAVYFNNYVPNSCDVIASFGSYNIIFLWLYSVCWNHLCNDLVSWSFYLSSHLSFR
jgi:hypothetical protein